MPRSIVSLTSTACPACGEPLTSTILTPPHGSPASANTQRLPASRTPSSTAWPVWRWSAMFRKRPSASHDAWWLTVITTSGRCRRIAAAMSRRSGRPYSTRPSGWSRNSTLVTPTTAALARSSASRSRAHSAGGSVSIPASPRVTSRYAIVLPWLVQRAIALAAPYSRSSGCATTARARSHSSGTSVQLRRLISARRS